MPRSSKKVCAQPGCPLVVDTPRCATHTRTADQARGTRQQRGYGRAHELERERLLPEAYGQPCPACGVRMWPHDDLHLDHTEDRTAYRGIVHARCNTSEAATRGNLGRSTRPS